MSKHIFLKNSLKLKVVKEWVAQLGYGVNKR